MAVSQVLRAFASVGPPGRGGASEFSAENAGIAAENPRSSVARNTRRIVLRRSDKRFPNGLRILPFSAAFPVLVYGPLSLLAQEEGHRLQVAAGGATCLRCPPGPRCQCRDPSPRRQTSPGSNRSYRT